MLGLWGSFSESPAKVYTEDKIYLFGLLLVLVCLLIFMFLFAFVCIIELFYYVNLLFLVGLEYLILILTCGDGDLIGCLGLLWGLFDNEVFDRKLLSLSVLLKYIFFENNGLLGLDGRIMIGLVGLDIGLKHLQLGH